MKILEKWFENLKEIREELIDTVKTITEEEFTWEPKPGMKSAKALLIEIAVGELWLNHFLTNPDKPLLWKEAFTLVKGDTLASLLAELDSIRKNTLKLYSEYPEADLFLEKTWPNDPEKTFSPEESMRYLIQHEYYHLGQLIYNRWMLGYNPYKSKNSTSG